MNRTTLALAFVATLGLAGLDAEAARRFGGGGNLGKQRAAPTATKEATPAPAQPAQAAPAQNARPSPAAGAAGAAGAAAAKPSFMSRWGGMLAGLGIGVLLASLFGAQLGPIVGMLLAALLLGLIAFALFRFFAGKRTPERPRPVQYAGIGSAVEAPPGSAPAATAFEPAQRRAVAIPGFEVAPFVRVAKTSFIRLQAANDSGDLDDIRDYTTPEMYAEIAMQVKERQGTQKTEVVSLDADVVEAVVEDGYEVASVRFWGLIRENDAANPEPFDETWHVRRKAGDRKATWLIAGIQQTA
jgi:predicted lipid-binding transport protein (Tim44 family)